MNDLSYPSMLQQAIEFASHLSLENVNWKKVEYKYQSESEAREILQLVNGELFDFIEAHFGSYPYWGDMCLNLSVAAFCYLKKKGYDAELVYGNVNVNNSPDDEFDVSRDSLANEYLNKIDHGEQNIHAWVGLGGDIVLDFALMPRLIKLYRYPSTFGDVILGPADYLKQVLKVSYKPLLVGTDFFKVTNSFDPLRMLEDLKK